MAGNSSRRGAKRTPGSKKGSVVGSGGQRRKQLKGKGPTPKATERTAHPAARRARAVAKHAGTSGTRPSTRSAAPRSRGGEAGSGPETVGGRNPVVEALRARVPATALYIAERIDSDDRVREALKLAAELHVPVLEAPRGELDRLGGSAPHQGLVLQVPAYDYAHPDDFLTVGGADPALVIALDGVTDPRNLGAVLRSAAAFGGHGVVVPARRAAGVTATAWKVSAGAAARVPVARATNLTRALESYREAGFFVVGLDGDGATTVDELDISTGPLVLVVGSEGKGLSRLVRETCDVIASIPITASTESLNAAVAAGIALYEVARARRTA
ncbi:MAG: rRNA (guanosine2251-2-O)-methyltransferase [Actinomycetota bacterium]|jgi:23S rRNA (guanosine2251-2'-O)-methyltransferase|nr:rRNA (guanosine2251-2-O)-methyltransferase [Actinomycetota bacterium]MDQ1666483.1 rRNA (guanosine2251-2-O)-methyltransferase [Actinomycetota bacterium]